AGAGGQIAGGIDGDPVGATAILGGAADRDRGAAQRAQGECDRRAAIAAAAADRLRDDRAGLVAMCRDVALAGEVHRGAAAAAAAAAADPDREADGAKRTGTGKAAAAPAPADRLREHAVRLRAPGDDVAQTGDSDARGVAASAARPAEADRGGAHADGGGDAETAVAPAAANGLRDDAARNSSV